MMSPITITEARKNLFKLVDQVAEEHQPLLLTGKRGNAVLLSEEDWNALQETLHLVRIPGMTESIRKGLATSLQDCNDEPGW